MSALEYRVTWRREGASGRSTRIYQRGESALAKASRILAMDRLDLSGTQFDGMPPLADGPTIEVRRVDDWKPNPVQVTEPTDHDLVGMDGWLDGFRGDQPTPAFHDTDGSVPI